MFDEILKDVRYAGRNIVTPVTPTDLRVFYEDKRPLLEYTGVCTLDNGMKVQVYIPKMRLQLDSIEISRIDDKFEYGGVQYLMKSQLNITAGMHDEHFTIKPLERTVTKAELEKELGYKLNIL